MSDRLFVATRKGLFRFDRARRGWRVTHTAFLGDALTLVLPDPRDRAVYAVLEHGHFGAKVHRSTDGGDTFAECGVPSYPAMPPGNEEKPSHTGKALQWSLDLIWALVPGGPDQPGTLWAGTIPGGLFRSDDHGATWGLNEALWLHPKRKEWMGGGRDFPGIHSICVHPERSDHLVVAVSCGGVWRSTDAGTTWECKADGMRAAYMPPELAHEPNIQDPHSVVQCRAAPDVYWCQHHNGIFRTTDGCESWHEVTAALPSAFGFATAVHPRDPDCAWFVPAIKDEKRIPVDGQVVVSRTRDGGRTFEVLRRGLPQEHAYDLTFRHALDIDASGDRLAFGSTTGSLWVSEDQGDQWQCVNEHLPPVHCVRWAD